MKINRCVTDELYKANILNNKHLTLIIF